MSNGAIKFEDKTSKSLSCTCGNNPMDSGFDALEVECENPHYKCNTCGAYACVDYTFRVVNNIDAAQAGVQAVG